MTIKEWAVLHKKELISAGGSLFACILFYGIFIYLPRPDLKTYPTSTKDSTITISGKAPAKVGVAIFDKSGNALMIVTSDVEGSFTITGIPVGEGKTKFSIRSVASGWRVSLPREITVEKDTMAPSLSINELKNATVTGSSTVISGKAEPGSTVTVNGVKTSIDKDGNWTATVSLQPGKNTVTVSATDAAGNTLTQAQTIQYQPGTEGSATGTANVTTSTSSLSPGSTAPTASPVSETDSATTPSPANTAPSATPTINGPDPAQLNLPPTTQSPDPAPKTILAITANTWVSNATPNERSNQTVYASVKDNFGRPVTNASVQARIYFKSGMATYSLTHTGSGTYATSFKLNDKFVDGYRVNVEVIASYNTLTAVANTGFTPRAR